MSSVGAAIFEGSGWDREPLHCTQDATEGAGLFYGDCADIPVGGDVRRACESSDKEWSIYRNAREVGIVLLDTDEP